MTHDTIQHPTDDERREQEGALLDGIEDDLIQISETGDGSRDYELVDGALFVNHYYEDEFDENSVPIPTGRYRVRISLERVAGGDAA